jgi:hypothetical protein
MVLTPAPALVRQLAAAATQPHNAVGRRPVRVALTELLMAPETGAAMLRIGTSLHLLTLEIKDWTVKAPKNPCSVRKGSCVMESYAMQLMDATEVTMMFRIMAKGHIGIETPREVKGLNGFAGRKHSGRIDAALGEGPLSAAHANMVDPRLSEWVVAA